MSPPLYLGVSGIEGYSVTPLIVGRRLLLDPVAVFLAVIIWRWLRGVPGTLLAVPFLVAIKVTCHHSTRLEPLAGRRRRTLPVADA